MYWSILPNRDVVARLSLPEHERLAVLTRTITCSQNRAVRIPWDECWLIWYAGDILSLFMFEGKADMQPLHIWLQRECISSCLVLCKHLKVWSKRHNCCCLKPLTPHNHSSSPGLWLILSSSLFTCSRTGQIHNGIVCIRGYCRPCGRQSGRVAT